MPNVYHQSYVCIQIDMSGQCTAWQQSSNLIDFEVASILIGFALLLNLIVFGFKYIKRSF